MKDPAKVAAGRKGGIAPHKGKRGFAADPAKASAAGTKGAQKGWQNKRSALDKFKLGYEYDKTNAEIKKELRKRTTK